MPDEFDWETGLFTGVGTVVDAWFAVAEQNPNTQLYLKLAGETGEEGEPRYGCGPDWASFDGGETVEHPKGNDRRFNGNTAIAQLFSEAFGSGAEAELRKRSQELYESQGPRHAGIWKGLKFRWEAKTEHMKFKDRTTGEMIERDVSRSFPVEFLAANTAVAQPSAEQVAAGQAAAAAAQQASTATADNPLSALLPEDAAKAKVLAKTTPYPEWVDKVMELTGAVTSPILMAALGDEALYNNLKEG